jgi:hypothetical protein
MATSTSTAVSGLPEGYSLEQPSAPPQQQQQPGDLPPGYTLEKPGQATSTPGEIKNDVGNTVIVPKDGESYLDTIKRAVAHSNSMTAEQHQAAFDKEVKTMPGKAATVLGAAPLIGAGGAAVLASTGGAPEADSGLIDAAGNAIKSADSTTMKVIAHLKNLSTVQKASVALGLAPEATWAIEKAHAMYKAFETDDGK